MSKNTKKSHEASAETENNNMNLFEGQQGAGVAPSPETEQPTAEPSAPDLTEEQKAAKAIREEQLAAAKAYIGHKAMYVPADDYEFYPATVVGASIDAKGIVLVALRTEDGKRVTKKYGSKLLRVLDEMADRPVRTRGKKERVPVSDEVINQHREMVGLPCVLGEFDGRIRGVQVDRRTCQIYLTVQLADGSKRHTKIDNSNLKVGEADALTAEVRDTYFALISQRANGSKSSPENQVKAHGAAFIAAYKQLIADGKIEETENLIDIIQEICDTVGKPADEAETEQTAE